MKDQKILTSAALALRDLRLQPLHRCRESVANILLRSKVYSPLQVQKLARVREHMRPYKDCRIKWELSNTER